MFLKRCLEIYQLHHAYILTVPGLALEAALKKIKVKLELSTDMVFYLWLNKELEVKYVTLLIDMKKANNKHIKIMMKIKYRHILNIGMQLRCNMIQQCPKSCL